MEELRLRDVFVALYVFVALFYLNIKKPQPVRIPYTCYILHDPIFNLII